MAKVAKATKRETVAPPPSSAAFIRAAIEAGVGRGQLENFLRAGVVLQPHQLRASAAARECDKPGGPTKVGFGGARGPGKSFWAIAQVVVDDCRRFPGLKVLLLRKVGKSNREAFDDLRRSVLHSVKHEYKRADGILELPNGSRVHLGHFKDERDVDKYLGLEYDIILVEEATTLSEAKVKVILTCLRTSKPDWRPRAYFTTNPGNQGHAWFKKMFVDPWRSGREIDTRFIPATVYDNRRINIDYRANLETLTGWQKRAWLFGDWDIAAGQYYTTWRHDAHVVKPWTPDTIEPHWRYWLSMDYGYAHWNMVYLMAADGDGFLRVLDEYGERRRLPEGHISEVDAMLARWRLNKHRLETFVAGGDVFQERGSEKTIAQRWEAGGYDLTRARMGRIDRASELLQRLGDPENGIAPRIAISSRCRLLIDCIPKLQHDPKCPDKVRKVDCDEDGEGGDDAFDGCGYGILEAANDTGGIGF